MPTKTIREFDSSATIADNDNIPYFSDANLNSEQIIWSAFKSEIEAEITFGSSDNEIIHNEAGVLQGDVGLTFDAVANTFNANPDVDAVSILGRARINSPGGDQAAFSHFDRGGTTDFAILQDTPGATNVNATLGQTLSLMTGAVARLTVVDALITSAIAVTITSGNLTMSGGDIQMNNNDILDVNFVNFSSTPNGLGFQSTATNEIEVTTDSAKRWSWSATGRYFAELTGAPSLENIAATATMPTVIHNNTDTTTGTGGVSGEYSIITGGAERLKVTDTLITASVDLTVNTKITIVAANATVADHLDISNGSDGFYRIQQGTGVASNFQPVITSQSKGSGSSTVEISKVLVADDTGSVAVRRYIVRQDDDTDIVNRPAYQWSNNATTLMQLNLTNLAMSVDLNIIDTTDTTFSTSKMLTRDTGGVINTISASGGAATDYLDGSGNWTVPAGGGGDVTKVGTPFDSQIGVWTGDGTIEGDPEFTWNTTTSVMNMQTAVVSDDIALEIKQLAVTGTGTAQISIETDAGAAAGDPFVQVGITAVRFYAFGIDNSSSDRFAFVTHTVPTTPSGGGGAVVLWNVMTNGNFTIATGNLVISIGTFQVSAAGTAADPTIKLGPETDGFYRSAANEISLSINNAQEYIYSATSLTLPSNNIIITQDGTAAAPAIQIGTETDGFFRNATNEIALSLNNLRKYTFSLGDLAFGEAVNLAFGGTTGTKIGVSSSQKFSFWGVTPVVQPSHIADPSGGGTQDAEARTAINSILAQMATIGLQASS